MIIADTFDPANPPVLPPVEPDTPEDVAAARAAFARVAHREEFGDSPGHVFHGNQWTGGQGSETNYKPSRQVQNDISSYTTNVIMSKRLENEVMKGPQVAPPLYRGLHADHVDGRQILDELRVGERVTLPLTSWSSDRGVGRRFASDRSPSMGSGAEFETKPIVDILLEMPAGARGLEIAPYGDPQFEYQKEWLIRPTDATVDTVTRDRAGRYVVKLK